MGMEHWWKDTDRGKLKCWPGSGLKYCNFYNGKITIWVNKGRITFNKAEVGTINLDHGSATRGPATLYPVYTTEIPR